jgi:hypothetical protein
MRIAPDDQLKAPDQVPAATALSRCVDVAFRDLLRVASLEEKLASHPAFRPAAAPARRPESPGKAGRWTWTSLDPNMTWPFRPTFAMANFRQRALGREAHVPENDRIAVGHDDVGRSDFDCRGWWDQGHQ